MKYSKWILGFVAGLMMAMSMANATAYHTVSGRGWASGGCYGGFGWRTCVNGIENRAENDSRVGAENQCRQMQGRLQSIMPTNCWTRCNPMFEPPRDEFRGVTCDAECNFTCVVN